MAMMISKFHKLIQSKLLWIVFFIVIVFSFVFWAMPGAARDEIASKRINPGKLFGHEVSPEDFRSAYYNSYLSACIMAGRQVQISDEIDELLNKAAWERIAQLELAGQLKLIATDNEVVGSIRTQPLFLNEQKQFDENRYRGFIAGFLRGINVSEPGFEAHVREEILLQKVRNMVYQSVFVTPFELTRAFHALTDTFDVEYVSIRPEDVESHVSVSDSDVSDYFTAHADEFTIPEKVIVDYVTFPVEEYMDGIEVSEEDALAYYNEHLDDFELEAQTNDTAAAYVPFEDVQEDLVKALTMSQAREKATEEATAFVLLLTAGRSGKAPTFEEAAAKIGRAIATSEPFAKNTQVKAFDPSARVSVDAFDLRPNKDDYYSNALVGRDEVYVVALKETIPERPATLTEVQDKVERIVEQDAIYDALTMFTKSFIDEAKTAISSGESFADLAEKYDLPLETMDDLTVATADMDDSLNAKLLQSLLSRNKNEVTDAIVLRNEILVAYVKDRSIADESKLATARPQLQQLLKRERSRNVFDSWDKYILEYADFQKTAPAAPADTAEEDDA